MCYVTILYAKEFSYMASNISIDNEHILDPQIWPEQILTRCVNCNEVIAMKVYSTLFRSPGLESHHYILFSFISRISLSMGGLMPRQYNQHNLNFSNRAEFRQGTREHDPAEKYLCHLRRLLSSKIIPLLQSFWGNDFKLLI